MPAVVVLNTSNPVAGAVTGDATLLAVRATLGIKSPWVAELMSSFAEASGVEVPIPIFCDWAKVERNKDKNNNDTGNSEFFITII